MLCENCQKRSATVVLKKKVDQEIYTQQLCEQCAMQEAMQEEALSVQQFIDNWFNQSSPHVIKEDKKELLRCPSCQLNYRRFLEEAKLGCADCYEAFRSQLTPVVDKLHRQHHTHIGKIPQGIKKELTLKRKIQTTREAMQAAVLEERFEEAAILRDEAKMLERQLGEGSEINGA